MSHPRLRPLWSLALALLALPMLPTDLFASAAQVHAAFGAVDELRQIATDFAGPAFVLSLAVAGYTWGLSRSDQGMRRAFNAALGFGAVSGAMALGTTLGFSGAVL